MIYTLSAEKDLGKLDRGCAIKILLKIDEYLKMRDPLVRAKKLKGFEMDTYRFRVGDYRVIFRLDMRSGKLVVLVVLKVAHRREVYKKG